jgi:hypothetical protein
MHAHSRLLRKTTALLCLWAMLFAQGAIAAHWGGMLARVLEAPAAGHGHSVPAPAVPAHGHAAGSSHAHDQAVHEHAAHGDAAHGTPADSGTAGERVCQTHGQFDIQTLDLPRLPALAAVLVGAAIAPVHAASSLHAGLQSAAALGCVRPPGAPPLSVLHCRFLI